MSSRDGTALKSLLKCSFILGGQQFVSLPEINIFSSLKDVNLWNFNGFAVSKNNNRY
jgi:hypothetical protein